VADLGRSRAFYEKVFGFETLLQEERIAARAVSGGSVLLFTLRPFGAAEPDLTATRQRPWGRAFRQPIRRCSSMRYILAMAAWRMSGIAIVLSSAVLAAPALADSQDQPEPAAPSWAEAQSAQCSAAVGRAEALHDTKPGLLPAIARAESGRPVPPLPGLQPWPWAVNADGAAMYFDSKPAAVVWTRLALARGVQQVDVGCMQVNLQSHPGAFRDLDEAFDPAANADYAARFLSRLRGDAGGDWWTAAGFYHSRTPVLAADYRERVLAIAEGRTLPAGLGLPLYVRAIRQGSLRIALAGGRVLRINVHRQPATRGPRRMDACQVAAVLGSYMAAAARARCGPVHG